MYSVCICTVDQNEWVLAQRRFEQYSTILTGFRSSWDSTISFGHSDTGSNLDILYKISQPLGSNKKVQQQQKCEEGTDIIIKVTTTRPQLPIQDTGYYRIYIQLYILLCVYCTVSCILDTG